jgi:hypothetical protein
LVKQRLVDHAALHAYQFGQRHHAPVGGAQRQRQQRVQADLRLARQLQPHRHRVLGVAVVQVGRVAARQRGTRLCAITCHRNAQRLGALALHAQEGARCVGVQRGVDAHDVGRVGKGLGHARPARRPASSGP